MTKHRKPIKRVKKRGKPHAPSPPPAIASKRRQWWALGIVLVVLVVGVVVIWQTGDKAEPTASSSQHAASTAQRHVTTILESHTQGTPQSVREIQKEELALAEALTQDFPQRDAPLALLARVHQYRGDITQAEALWKQAVALNPQRSDLYDSIGQAAQRKDLPDEAIAWWQKGLEANPRAPGLRWQIAKTLVAQGQLDTALELLEIERTITPTAARNHYLLGQVYQKQRAYQKAQAAYEKTIEIQPDYYNAYYGLGVVYTRLKQPEQAKTAMGHFRRLKASADSSEDQRIMIDEIPHARSRAAKLYAKAYSLYDPKQEERVCQGLLKRALELDPNDAHIWEKLAGHHFLKGRHQKALELFRKVTDLDPSNPLPHINIGKLYALMNQPGRAKSALQQTVARFPESDLAHTELARFYLRAQTDLPEARTLMQKAIALNPTAEHYFLLTWACDVNGDLDGALDAIQKAIALAPRNGKYRSTYERIRSKR